MVMWKWNMLQIYHGVSIWNYDVKIKFSIQFEINKNHCYLYVTGLYYFCKFFIEI